MLEPKYNHKKTEEGKYERWKNNGYFASDDKSNNSLSNDEQISKYMQEIGVDLDFFCSVGLIPNPIKVEYKSMSKRVKEKYREEDTGR